MKFIIIFITFCLNSSVSLFTNNNGFRQIAIRNQKIINKNKLRYIIDIDGTICTKTKSDYPKTNPIYENIDLFNQLYEKGHEIHYWTARGAISGKNWDKLTIKQLENWGVHYNTINMGKPHYDVWIDDKAINARHFCNINYE